MKEKKYQKKEIKKGLVSPIVASIFSLFLPGLGQVLAREIRRGILLFVSFITIGGLLVWRIFLAGRRYDGFQKIVRAYQLEPILIVISLMFLIIYVWIIIDAYFVAQRRSAGQAAASVGILFFVLLIFFILGWQIGQINLISFFARADEAVPTVRRVLWPWERAIEYPEDYRKIIAEVQAPCDENPPPKTEPKEDEPYLVADPTCGSPSEIDGEPGTEITLTGYNFDPDEVVEIWWKDPINNEFRQRAEGDAVVLTPNEEGYFQVDVIMPYRVLPPNIGEGSKIWQVQARQLTFVGDAQISSELKLTLEKMVETIIIGMMATFFGIILALPLSFLAAKNLMSANSLTIGVYYIIRTFLNVVRSIEPLIWAIIAVIVVGLGPFAGIIALTVHSMAALAKLYSESIESIDPGPIEAIQATGANWLQTVAFAVVPQFIPPFVSFTVYRWDINIRMSTVIGFVGGGGIGYLLQQWIRLLDYRAAGMAVWFIAISVMILDYVSAEIRERFV